MLQQPPSEPLSQDVSPTLNPSGKTAPLQEVFSSIQGEALYVGKRQVFVRFAHCHLKCAYCDTPMTSATGQCHVEDPPGSGLEHLYPNPMRPQTLLEIIGSLLKTAKHHSVSFTGGEPLLYHGFLKELLPQVQKLAPTYLETSGTQPEFLQTVLPWLDFIAMDIKLPSATKEAPQFEQHARFYQMSLNNPNTQCFIKLVFNTQTTLAELDAVKAIVTDRNTPIILQPETSLIDRSVSIQPKHLFDIENHLAGHFNDVRIIPQTHKMLNVL